VLILIGKSHTCFRQVQKSVTLNDLEQLLHTSVHVFVGRKCSKKVAQGLYFQALFLMEIFTGITRRIGIKQESAVVENSNFHCFLLLYL